MSEQETAQPSAQEKALGADPAPLGLMAFAFTTFMLSFVNAGIIPAAGGLDVVIPLALVWGGIAQLICGAFEMRRGNTFGFTAFSSYGAFWIFVSLMLIFNSLKIIAITDLAFGFSLLLWGVFSLLLWMYARKAAFTLNMTFLCLFITYFFLGIGDITGVGALNMIGGIIGIVCAFFAAWTAFNIIMASAPKK
ncbi:MAG TPA: acetate uptake transporter [Candidatus Lokiarchaeia archaeon]|nr:acetate uptake transporter [Candidatus Lokiarchaeia archaeon]